MTVRLNPYLNFRDDAREAVEFYRSVFGGELDITTFADMGMGEGADGAKIMHSWLKVDGVLDLMVADTPTGMDVPGAGTIALSGDDEAVLRGWWDALAEGATVTMPLERAPWGDSFGQLTDRFGVPWLVNITAPTS